MLLEFLESLITPCPPQARRLGYLREAVAIRARHGRCRDAWQPHLTACRSAITQAADRCARRELALVLGSGALLDIPLEVLSGMFGTVVLADLVHPVGARLRSRALANVRQETADLSGVVDQVDRGLLPEPPPMDRFLDLAPDLVVSANILSQLPLAPLKALAATGQYPPERLEAFAAALVREHLAWLGRFPGVRLLITDTAWEEGESADSRHDAPLYGAPLPAPWKSWTWRIAPRPEAYRDKDVVHQVRAFLL